MYDRSRKSSLSALNASIHLNERIVQVACILALFLIYADGLLSSSEPLVNTKWGLIHGKWSKSKGDRLIANFLGIPYAIPPLGELRFRNPQRWNRAWKVRDAMVDGSSCLQINRKINKFFGSEDCLYLNVYVPYIPIDRQETANLSVLVFVHGGAFKSGSSSSQVYAPDYLLDKDIILVTLNYRLDVLGFFSTTNEAAPGNYGLKDIKMALEWIQENIHSFNGNPESVTLMGHSAGAVLVHLLALSFKTEGLFHKFILQSGSALNEWAVNTNKKSRQYGLQLARLVGCLLQRYECTPMSDETMTESPQKNSVLFNNVSYIEKDEEMMKCMRTVDAKKLVNMTHDLHAWRGNPVIIFNPVMEDDSEDAIVTVNPIRALKEGRFRDIPAIMQLVKDEGLLKSIDFITDPVIREELLDTYIFDEIFPHVVESQRVINVTTIKDFYFNRNSILDSMQNLTNLIGDYLLLWPQFRAMEYQSKMSNSSIYFSFFQYEGTFSHTFISGNTTYFGVSHVDDLNYFFPIWNDQLKHLMLSNTKNDYIMIDIMTEMWTNFVIEGIPRASTGPEWPDYREYQRFMRFGIDKSPDIVVQADFLSDRMEFWEKLMADVPEAKSIECNLFIDPPSSSENMISSADTNSCKLISYIILLILAFYWSKIV